MLGSEPHPCGTNDGKTGTVCNVVVGRKGVFDHVHGGEHVHTSLNPAIEGDDGCPLHLCTRFQIAWIGNGLASPFNGIDNGTFGKTVLNGGAVHAVEIPFHHMGNDIAHAVGGLILGNGQGQFGIDHGDLRIEDVGLDKRLDLGLVIGNDRTAVHLGTGSCQSGYSDYGQCFGGDMPVGLTMSDQIPRIAIIQDSRCNHFGSIHGASATESDDHIAPFGSGYLGAAGNGCDAGVGLNARAFGVFNTGSLEAFYGLIKGAVALDAATAGDNQGLFAIFRRHFSQTGQISSTKNQTGRVEKFKIHYDLLLGFMR